MIEKVLVTSIGFSLGLLSAGVAIAQSSQTQSSFTLGTVEIIDVAGTRQSDWTSPLQATIQNEDLRRFERNDVSSALSLLPGITIQNSGGRSEKLVYLRGFNSRQVPLFIDGIPVYVPYDGNFDLSRLLTFDVDSISVSKGYSPILYGANALGGSINIVSKRPQKGLHAAFRSGINFDNNDNDNSRYYTASVQKAEDLWYIQSTLSLSEQDSFTLPSSFVPTVAENGGVRENSDTRDLKLALKLGYTPNETDEYTLSYQRQDGEKNTPPYAGTAPNSPRYWRWPQYDKESLYFISNTALGDDTHVRLRAYYDTFVNTLKSFDNATYTSQSRPYAFSSIYDDYSVGFSSELGTSRYEGHTLRAGLQYKRDVHREHDIGFPSERMEDAVTSIGLEDAIALRSDLVLALGAGYDRQQGRLADDLQGITMNSFPTATVHGWNAQSALTYTLNDAWSTHISAARRTRFPTMKDRYSYRLGTAIPNPGLIPEYALNLEIGINGDLYAVDATTLKLSAALFRSTIDDTIESVTVAPTLCTSAPCSQLQNIGRQVNSGAELGLTAHINNTLELHGNYTYLDRDNKSSPTLLPLDTPQHKVFGYVQYAPLEQLELILSAQHESERNSATNGTRRTGSFTTTDFKAVWHFSDQLQLEAGGRNLGDKLYAFEEGFPEPGRSWFMNVSLAY